MITSSKDNGQYVSGVENRANRFSTPSRSLFLALLLASCGAPTRAHEQSVASNQSAVEAKLTGGEGVGKRDEVVAHQIEIRDFKFVPDKLTVRKGDKIVWKKLDAVPHTATAGDKRWDSGLIASQAEWAVIVDQIGEIDYLCKFHPVMKAKLIVVE